MPAEPEKKGPIMCRKDGLWKLELDRRLKTDDSITLLALGDVKNELLAHLNRRKDIEIIKMETRYMKKREKGMGLKVTVKSRQKPTTESKQ
jgi:hypothetical protein